MVVGERERERECKKVESGVQRKERESRWQKERKVR